MGVKDLLVHLWVLSAAVQTRQASQGLSVSPNVTATCGQPVTLHCNVSSYRDDMMVHHLSWIRNTATLCNWKDNLADEQPASDVKCRSADKSLSVTFLQPSPQQSRTAKPQPDKYTCKLRSNQGTVTERTWVEFKECIQRVDSNTTAEGLRCTFKGVSPDREVHWLHGNTRLTESDGVIETKESMDKECCLTIISSLRPKNHTVPYTCAMWNSESKNYTSSHKFPFMETLISPTVSGMVGPQWSIGNCLVISVLLMSL